MSRVLLDVDGVAGDFTGDFLRDVGSKLTREAITEWDVFGFVTEEEKNRGLEFLKTDAFWLNLSVLPGAIEGVEALIKDGHEIYWVTSPWLPCRTWEANRREWLEKHFGTKHTHVVPCFDKHVVVGDYFADDKVEHVTGWSKHHPSGHCYLFDAPHNANSPKARVGWEAKKGVASLVKMIRSGEQDRLVTL